LAATDTGGIYQDYHIASQTEAYSFYWAGGGNPAHLDTVGYNEYFTTNSAYVEGLFGENLNEHFDMAWFLSDEINGAGFLQVRETSTDGSYERRLRILDIYPGHPDGYAVGGFYSGGNSVLATWLLVFGAETQSPPENLGAHPPNIVPLPASAWLFITGLLWLLGYRRSSEK